MAEKIILADTSVLIDFFRKTDMENSILIHLFDQGYDFSISAITYYEIYSGTTTNQLSFWKNLLQRTKTLALDEEVAQAAIDINIELKRKRN
jgi:tRNA(fMet)-specific endonuclease VapC